MNDINHGLDGDGEHAPFTSLMHNLIDVRELPSPHIYILMVIKTD